MTKIINKTYLSMVVAFLLSSCAYYGTNTFLVPSSEDNYFMCSNMTIRIDGILTDQNNKVYSFAGIPVFPAVSTSDRIGELYVWYDNISDWDICSTVDLYLKDRTTESIHLPNAIWKSKIVEKDNIKYLGCNYKFGQQLDEKKEYSLHFREDIFNCKLPIIILKVEKDSGQHQIPLQ